MLAVEEDLRAELCARFGTLVRLEPRSDQYFRLLERRFPLFGSKVDWARVPGSFIESVNQGHPDIYRDEGKRFFERVRHELRLADDLELVVIGDAAMDMALHAPASIVGACLDLVLDMPQHTHVLPPDGAWCASFTMEGDLCFGKCVS